MRAAMIGDNCIDLYPGIDRRYPTGNAVDTGVHLKRLGWQVSLVSVTGSDSHGRLMVDTLKREGLNLSHLRVEEGATAVTYMELNGRDRVHGDYVEGVLENITFSQEDIRFAARHDLVHTAYWGKADGHLASLKQHGAVVSFDFADRWDSELARRCIPQVDIGFFSLPDKGLAREFLPHCTGQGMATAVATFGSAGSMAWDGRAYYEFGIHPAQVVNTVGAGDSFIAGFLDVAMRGGAISDALDQGARLAARVVSVFEPWEMDVSQMAPYGPEGE